MKPYKKLTRLGRLRRTRKLAREALRSYDLENEKLKFLRYFANITYRVDLPEKKTMAKRTSEYLPNRYLLRILLSDHWSFASGEMTWLAALGEKGGLPVPSPVPTKTGELMVRVATPGIPEGRIVSLMRWIDGHGLRSGMQNKHFRSWGRIVGQMHAFAAQWKPPSGFQRYTWDWEGLLGGRGFNTGLDDLVDTIPMQFQAPYKQISQTSKTVMEALGTSSDAFGMVHGDMTLENVLFKAGQVRLIDFEDCGFGHWLWDIAVALSEVPWTDEWRRTRDAFLSGYLQTHPIPDTQLAHLDLFIAAQYATGVLWSAQFILDEPGRKAEHVTWQKECGETLLKYPGFHY